MTRLVAASLTILLATTAVAHAQDGGGRRGRGDRGGEQQSGEWRGRGGNDGAERTRDGGRQSSGQPQQQQQYTPRDTGQRPNGGLYVPRPAPQAPPAAITNNGGLPVVARNGGGPRDGQGWRGDQGGRSGADQGGPRNRDFGNNGGGPRGRDAIVPGGGNGGPPVVARNDQGRGDRGGQWNGGDRDRDGVGSGFAQDNGRGRGDYNLEGGPRDGRGRGGDDRSFGDGRNDRGSDRWTERGHDNAGYNQRDGDRRFNSGRGDRGRPGDGHGFRDRDHGRSWYSPHVYYPHYRAPYRYRAAPYYYPNNWYARSWSFGDYLPGGWYSTRYYLDWRAYGLAYPPIGCEWVRVGGDALLVDVWTGEVLSVYYGLFW